MAGHGGLGAVQKRTDIKKIMILGAGPIVIGQACEFDYSGTQACKSLKAEGYEVVLINSNPATIMTDPGTADRTYVCPMNPELVETILAKEKPDALLPTMGGQTALNLAKALAENGALERQNVELIGAKLDAINKAEDRQLFKEAMQRIGCKTPPSQTVNTVEEALEFAKTNPFPLILRPAFTCGGAGGGIAYNQEEFVEIMGRGLEASTTSQVLVERSLLGWKEFELEVMRDLADNVVIVCSIENIDPMGVHTGDSITLAPAQTLTDKEYQRMRDQAVAIIREIGVECGGSNVQFTVNPADGELMVIEMNPRVSRSSALASKATGFPIAKIAAKLAVGYTLDEVANDITEKTPASFEPSIDYVVTKIPRFAFEKFPGTSSVLTTQMKSVGEAMSMGRTFQESFQKAMRSLETGLDGFSPAAATLEEAASLSDSQYEAKLRVPTPERMLYVKAALETGRFSVQELFELTAIDPWFLEQWSGLAEIERYLSGNALGDLSDDDLLQVKQRGYSDKQIARYLKGGATELEVRARRYEAGIEPCFRRVDTCAAEFEAYTPYLYGSYRGARDATVAAPAWSDGNGPGPSSEAPPTSAPKVIILGGGPNRIGQGIEFDYCCCHASYALRAAGFETIMVNSNPETVSTDYDTSDRLYFEPLTVEDVLSIIRLERPNGIIVQFGGQTPLKLAEPLEEELTRNPIPAANGDGNVRVWGTSPASIALAEDRQQWLDTLTELEIAQPAGGTAASTDEAATIADRVGYPVMVRPSFVLGGRAMEVVYSPEDLKGFVEYAMTVNPDDATVLVDKYLANATELDVDALSDAEGNVTISGIMEHVEQAGVHSGDSACFLPPQTVPAACLDIIREQVPRLARKLKVVGLINLQYAVLPASVPVPGKDGEFTDLSPEQRVFLIEANPRASRTVPFVAKAVGHPIATYASLLMSETTTLAKLGFTEEPTKSLSHVAVKEAVLPFDKFPGADTLLGPEMRSTGEVMGIDASPDVAYAKAQLAAGQVLPSAGKKVFVSMNEVSKEAFVPVAKGLVELGFALVGTAGTASFLGEQGVECERVLKVHEGRPHAKDMVTNGEIAMMMITPNPSDPDDSLDGRELRRSALAYKVPIVTTIAGCKANVEAMRSLSTGTMVAEPLQDFFPDGVMSPAEAAKL